jgi:hypothetical protein
MKSRLTLTLSASALALALAACGGSTATKPAVTKPPATSSATAAPAGTGQVLPVKENPIKNTSTTKALVVGKILVEDNADPVTKKTVGDHLEIPLSNTGTTALGGFEIFYTFTDTKTNESESYYAKLPDSFTIAPGASRVAHFDKTGAPDHFPVNAFSLYATSKNALNVSVVVSAAGAAPETASVKKDAGGSEQAD